MIQFNHPTLITITAPTCSGKSYLLDELTQRALISRIVSTTTRPQRPGERQGLDYDFISLEQSLTMEARGEFFELIEFNGVRYGVTHDQMNRAMSFDKPPIIILEPQGLQIYREKCMQNGWNIFQVYVHTTESERIKRLNKRTEHDIALVVDMVATQYSGRYTAAFTAVSKERAVETAGKIVASHTSRLLSITGDERRWQGAFSWDAIVPGDDVEKAISMIEQGVKWRNTKLTRPEAIGAVKLPL